MVIRARETTQSLRSIFHDCQTVRLHLLFVCIRKGKPPARESLERPWVDRKTTALKEVTSVLSENSRRLWLSENSNSLLEGFPADFNAAGNFWQHEMLLLPRFGHFPARKMAAGTLAQGVRQATDFGYLHSLKEERQSMHQSWSRAEL